MGFSPADCEALLSLAKGLSYQIGIKYGYCLKRHFYCEVCCTLCFVVERKSSLAFLSPKFDLTWSSNKNHMP